MKIAEDQRHAGRHVELAWTYDDAITKCWSEKDENWVSKFVMNQPHAGNHSRDESQVEVERREAVRAVENIQLHVQAKA